MTRIYTRHSTEGVYVVKRQDPSQRSNNKRRDKRHSQSDTVELGARDVSEDEIYTLLNERLTFHLKGQLEGSPFEIGFASEILGPKTPASESAAYSIFRFATKHHEAFKASCPLLSDGEARLQFATLIVSSLDEAVEDVFDLVLELTGVLEDALVGSVEKFRELAVNVLSDFVEGSHGAAYEL